MSTSILRGNIQTLKLIQVTYDPASVAANTSANNATTISVPGLRTTDYVVPFKPTTSAGATVVGARCSAADTLQVALGNFTASPVDAGSETWTFLIIRPDVQTYPADAL